MTAIPADDDMPIDPDHDDFDDSAEGVDDDNQPVPSVGGSEHERWESDE